MIPRDWTVSLKESILSYNQIYILDVNGMLQKCLRFHLFLSNLSQQAIECLILILQYEKWIIILLEMDMLSV